MASISDISPSRASGSPLRALVIGAAALTVVAIGLRVMATEESSFYRSHGMVPDARTAVRLAGLVLADPSHGCAGAGAQTAHLAGEVWTVEARPDGKTGLCRVELGRRDGQVLKVETLR